MFVQTIKGKTNNPAKLKEQAERWQVDVRPGAVGFLGGTCGVADDGTFIFFAALPRRGVGASQFQSRRTERMVGADGRLLRWRAHVP